MVPEMLVEFVDGGLDALPEGAGNAIAVVSTSSLGEVGTLYAFGGSSVTKVKEALGEGLGPDVVASILSTPGHGAVYYAEADSSAESAPTVTKSGTGPDVTCSTGARRAFEVVLEVLTGGALGTATGRWSLDGGRSWSKTITLAASVVLSDAATVSGLTLSLAAGTYVAGDTYTAKTLGPVVDAADAAAAVDVIKAAAASQGLRIHWVHVDTAHHGATDADRASAAGDVVAAVASKVDGWEAAGSERYIGCSFSMPLPVTPGTAGGRAAYRSALSTEFAALENKRLALLACPNRATSDLDGKRLRNGGTCVVARLSAAPISEHLGRFASGALRGVVEIELDESAEPGLDAAGFTTLRTHADAPGFFVNRGLTRAGDGSDYQPIHRLRVANRFAELLRDGARQYLNDDLIVEATGERAGKILEAEARAIDEDLTFQSREGLRGHVSDVAARVSREDVITSSGRMTVEGSIAGKGYAESVRVVLGFARSLGVS